MTETPPELSALSSEAGSLAEFGWPLWLCAAYELIRLCTCLAFFYGVTALRFHL